MQSITLSKIIEKRADIVGKVEETRRIVKEKIKQEQKMRSHRENKQD